MKKVTGIGGIFFKAKDPEGLRQWYGKHLGIESEGESGASFRWREIDNPEQEGLTVWSPFPSIHWLFRAEQRAIHDQLSRRRS